MRRIFGRFDVPSHTTRVPWPNVCLAGFVRKCPGEVARTHGHALGECLHRKILMEVRLDPELQIPKSLR